MSGGGGPLGGDNNQPVNDAGTFNLGPSRVPGVASMVRRALSSMVMGALPPPSTVFHPGDCHGHLPSGRWSEVQAAPDTSSFWVDQACRHLSPRHVVDLAIKSEFGSKPIALQHLNWYLSVGKGADFIEDKYIADWLTRDRGAQAAIARAMPSGVTTGQFVGSFKFEQKDYADDAAGQDFCFAWGAIDILDFEVDFDAGTIHVWFQDRYEWHPYYPKLYPPEPGDLCRETNCLHAALVELKSAGADDFWMKGEATVPLSLIVAGKSYKPKSWL